MKKIKLICLSLVLLAGTTYAQNNKVAEWPQMKAFHTMMAATFHPAEDGNLQPLREKADSLYNLAKLWQGSAIPSNYKTKETGMTLALLGRQCSDIAANVRKNASDEELKKMISEAHETFHKVMGECKKSDEPAH